MIPPYLPPPAVVYKAFGNLTQGDCQAATVGNIVQTIDPSAFVTQASIEAIYHRYETRYRHAASDAGFFQDLIAPYWRTHSIGGYRLRSWHVVPLTRRRIEAELVRHRALYAEAYVPTVDGTITGTWTLRNSPRVDLFGHTFAVVGYSSNYVEIVTWGALQRVTWAWFDTYATGIYAISITPNISGYTSAVKSG